MTIRTKKPTVALLLSTYNGASYLPELLGSLRLQTYGDFTLYVRDDGSSDNTLGLLQNEGGLNIVILNDTLGNLGPARSFMQLLDRVSADIYCFCDQDDVWLHSKIENAIEVLLTHGLERPLLYHCDATVVGSDLQLISQSVYAHQGVEPGIGSEFKRVLLQNCIFGCTMAFTDELLVRAAIRTTRPNYLVMHDWWIALCASAFGQIVFDPRPGVLYRQHDRNVSGAKKRGLIKRLALQFSASGIIRINDYRNRIAHQAEAFVHVYRVTLGAEYVEDGDAVAAMVRGTGLKGIWRCFRRGIRLQNAYMNCAIVFSALLSPLFVSVAEVKRARSE